MKQLDLFKDDDDLFIEECENFISELESNKTCKYANNMNSM